MYGPIIEDAAMRCNGWETYTRHMGDGEMGRWEYGDLTQTRKRVIIARNDGSHYCRGQMERARYEGVVKRIPCQKRNAKNISAR